MNCRILSNESEINMRNKVICLVCKEKLKPSEDIISTDCGHVYHYVCIEKWIEKTPNCPQCRIHYPKLSTLFLTFDEEDDLTNNRDRLEENMAVNILQVQLESAVVDSSKTRFQMEKTKLQESEMVKELQLKETLIKDLEASKLVLQKELVKVKCSLLQLVDDLNIPA